MEIRMADNKYGGMKVKIPKKSLRSKTRKQQLEGGRDEKRKRLKRKDLKLI